MIDLDARGGRAATGRLIAFEGPNEVGKTTISQAFSRLLESRGRPCEWHAFPGRMAGALGRHVYDIHHRPETFGLGEIAPSAVQALHVAAHLDAIERIIHPKLAAGVDIVLDRFWWSTIAYGVATGVSQPLLDSLVSAELVAWNGLEPTLVVVLDRRLPATPDEPVFEARLREEYLRLVRSASRRHPARFVDNNGTVEQAVTGVADLLENLSALIGDWI